MDFKSIINGRIETDKLSSSRDSRGYKIAVGTNQKLVIRLDGPDQADFDLYVRYGREVSPWEYDFRRITQNADEELTIGPTQEGEYFILVYAYRGRGSFSLEVNVTYEEVLLPLGQQVSGEIGASKEARYFNIPTQPGQRLILDLNGPIDADFDLYLSYGQRPTNARYDQRSFSGSSKERITVESTQGGSYFAMVHSYRGSGSFTLGAGSGFESRLVIITSRKNLETKYGSSVTRHIEEKIESYAQSVSASGQTANIIYVDDSESLAPYNLDPAEPQDASAIKSLLDQLDSKIHGNHFLILGGHEIIPFHVLPNPCGDDGDTVVYSDNPYASRDDDLLIPERALTRLPDDSTKNGDFIIALLEQVSQRAQTQNSQTFGLSAKEWEGASQRVYQDIETTKRVLLSPPVISDEVAQDWIDNKKMFYFNLHGSEETPNWYGQEDTRYPIAFKPMNLNSVSVENAVICCEACYGANIIDKRADDALSLSFLKKKAACFVGSTKIAYGPSDPPSTDADLVVVKFFERVREGLRFGEAFLKAKEDFARESIQAKGYLDKTDEKTLLEFVIYADPLAKMEA